MTEVVTASELRKMNSKQLDEEVEILRLEHQKLLQQKHSHSIEPSEVKIARKNITRCMHIAHEKQLEALVEEYKGKRFIPKQLRPKLNRAMRRQLTDNQKKSRVKRVRLHASKYPKKIFAFVN